MTTEKRNVQVKRTELLAPDLADPKRVIVQIEYQIGELPPRTIFIPKKDWTKEKEAAAIKADLDKRLAPPGETISI